MICEKKTRLTMLLSHERETYENIACGQRLCADTVVRQRHASLHFFPCRPTTYSSLASYMYHAANGRRSVASERTMIVAEAMSSSHGKLVELGRMAQSVYAVTFFANKSNTEKTNDSCCTSCSCSWRVQRVCPAVGCCHELQA